MDFLEEVLEGRLDLEIGFSAGVLIAISAQHAIAETRLGPTTVGCLEKAALASNADICQREQISALLLGLMASSFPRPKTQKNTASNSRETFCAGLGRTTSASTSDD